MNKCLFLTITFIITFTLSAKDLVITKLSTSSIKIGNRTLHKGGTFSDNEVIYWSSPNQDMKAKPKSGGLPRHYSAKAFRSKSKESLSIKQYLMYLNKTNHPSTLSSEMELKEGRNKDKFQEKRLALVIGNSNYENFSPDLDCPISDAEDVSNKLNELGFDTFTLYDANYMDFCNSLTNLNKVAKSDEYNVVLFYYCGHGNQYNGMNYLLPSSAQNTKPEHVEGWVSFDYIFDTFENLDTAICKTRLVFLDACRNTPSWETNNVGSRLDQYKTNGAFVVFSTENYTVALGSQEEESRNTPFGSSFLETVDKPSENITLTINKLSESVKEKTAYYSSYGKSPRQVYTFGVGNVDFSFVPGVNIEALLNKTQYYLSIDNPEMAIISLYEIKKNYNYLELNQKKEYDFLLNSTNESLLKTNSRLTNINDTNTYNKKKIDYSFINNYPFTKFIRDFPVNECYTSDVVLYLNPKSNKQDTIPITYPIVSDSNRTHIFLGSEQFHVMVINLETGEDKLLDNIQICLGGNLSYEFPKVLAINNECNKIIYIDGNKFFNAIYLYDLVEKKTYTLKKAYHELLDYKYSGFSPNGNLFFLYKDNRIDIYNTSSLLKLQTLKYEKCDTVFWDNKNSLCVSYYDNVYVWDINEFEKLKTYNISKKICDVTLSDKNEYLSTIDNDGDIYIFNLINNKTITYNNLIEAPSHISFTHDSQKIFASTGFYEITMFDLMTLEKKSITVLKSYENGEEPNELEIIGPRDVQLFMTPDNKYCLTYCYMVNEGLRMIDINSLSIYDADFNYLSKIFKKNISYEEDPFPKLSNEDENLIFESSIIELSEEDINNNIIIKKKSNDGTLTIEVYDNGLIKIIPKNISSKLIELFNPSNI